MTDTRPDNNEPLGQLVKNMAASFNMAELGQLCMDLEVDIEELPGEAKSAQIRSLVKHLWRVDRLPYLLIALIKIRNHIEWPDLTNMQASADEIFTNEEAEHQPSVQINVGEGGAAAYGDGATAVASRGVYVNGDVYGNIHTGDVINYYITINEKTHIPQFTSGIQSFLEYYLGTEEAPKPFGGRDRQLQQLNEWLEQGKTQRLLLVAPAGRGKSALLVRWSSQFTQTDNIDVVFMPISLRFNTNLEENTFIILATRLAYFYGKEIPTDYLKFTPQDWRRLVAKYLREPLPDGRQLLLIIDGLDEAAWDIKADLFSMNLPETTRIIVSARYLGGEDQTPEPWIGRLGWDGSQKTESIELEALTPDGVRQVLENMRLPADSLSQELDIATELYRLSEGDPLLVELYVGKLWERENTMAPLTTADLQAIEPGYKGYFDRWLEEQKTLWGNDRLIKEPLARTLLSLLALTYGPLVIDDVQELLPESLFADSILISEIINNNLKRLVIGDGMIAGYVFSHPKLADYFSGRLSRRDKKIWQKRILDWGAQTLRDLKEELYPPREASSYLMLYYGRHLEEANTPIEELLTLVSWEWMQVWLEKTGSYTGFLQDVDRVWNRLRQENESAAHQGNQLPYIGQEILCALCHASVNSLSDKIPDKLLMLLLQYKLWTEEQVIAYIRQRTDIKKRWDAYITIADHLSEETRLRFEREILVIVREIDAERYRAEILSAVAPHQSQEVLAAALQIENEERQAQVLSAVAPHLPQQVLAAALQINAEGSRVRVLLAVAAPLPQEVLAAAQQIDDEGWWAVLLMVLAAHLPQQVLTAALQIENEEKRAQVLTAVAPHLPLEVLAAAQQINAEGSRAKVLTAVASQLPLEVLAAAQQIDDEGSRAKALMAVAPHLPLELRKQAIEDALAAAQQIDDAGDRARVLIAVAPHLPLELRKQALEDVLAAAQQIDDAGDRARVLTAVAPHLPLELCKQALEDALAAAQQINFVISRVKSRAEALTAVAAQLPLEVLAAARQIDDERDRARVLTAVAAQLPHEVLAAAQQINDEGDRARVLRAVAAHLPQEVLATAQQINDEGDRVELLGAVAPHLSLEVRKAAMEDALAAALQIDDEWSQARFLIAVAPHLPQEVLAAALQINFKVSRAEVLTAVAPHLPLELRKAAMEDAFAAARQINDVRSRAEVLTAVAPYLPHEVLAAALQINAERYQGYQARVLTAVAPHLPHEVLAAAQQIDDVRSRAWGLIVVAPHLPQEVSAVAQQIDDEGSRAWVLTAVAPHLPLELRKAAMEEAFAATQQIDDEGFRVEVLRAMAPHLPQEVLATAQQIDDEWYRAVVLTAVAPHLPQELCKAAMEEALTAAQQIDSEYSQASVLAAVAPHLPQEVLAAALQIDIEVYRAGVLAAVALHLPQEVFAAALQIDDEGSRARALTAVAPHLPLEVLMTAQQINDVSSRAEILAAVAPHLLPQSIISDWQDTILFLSKHRRSNSLIAISKLVSSILDLGGDPALVETWQAVKTVSNWWP